MVEESINDKQPEKLDDFSEEKPCEDEGGIMRRKMTLQKLFKYVDKVDMVAHWEHWPTKCPRQLSSSPPMDW